MRKFAAFVARSLAVILLCYSEHLSTFNWSNLITYDRNNLSLLSL